MRSLYVFTIGCLLWSCRGPGRELPDPGVLQEELIEANRNRHQGEKAAIDAFVKEKGWPVTETGSGLRYWIYEPGNGPATRMEQRVLLTYSISLTDGTVCYRNDGTPGAFVIGRDQVESGLHELLLLMHLGDRARAIMPSHLAFGLTGDSAKIPPNATLVYDVHLIGLEE